MASAEAGGGGQLAPGLMQANFAGKKLIPTLPVSKLHGLYVQPCFKTQRLHGLDVQPKSQHRWVVSRHQPRYREGIAQQGSLEYRWPTTHEKDGHSGSNAPYVRHTVTPTLLSFNMTFHAKFLGETRNLLGLPPNQGHVRPVHRWSCDN